MGSTITCCTSRSQDEEDPLLNNGNAKRVGGQSASPSKPATPRNRDPKRGPSPVVSRDAATEEKKAAAGNAEPRVVHGNCNLHLVNEVTKGKEHEDKEDLKANGNVRHEGLETSVDALDPKANGNVRHEGLETSVDALEHRVNMLESDNQRMKAETCDMISSRRQRSSRGEAPDVPIFSGACLPQEEQHRLQQPPTPENTIASDGKLPASNGEFRRTSSAEVVDMGATCHRAHTVALDEVGYSTVSEMRDTEAMSIFISRLIKKGDGMILEQTELRNLAMCHCYNKPKASFDSLIDALSGANWIAGYTPPERSYSVDDWYND